MNKDPRKDDPLGLRDSSVELLDDPLGLRDEPRKKKASGNESKTSSDANSNVPSNGATPVKEAPYEDNGGIKETLQKGYWQGKINERLDKLTSASSMTDEQVEYAKQQSEGGNDPTASTPAISEEDRELMLREIDEYYDKIDALPRDQAKEKFQEILGNPDLTDGQKIKQLLAESASLEGMGGLFRTGLESFAQAPKEFLVGVIGGMSKAYRPIAAGVSAYSAESKGALAAMLEEEGVDIRDTESLADILQDRDKVQEIRRKARNRGLSVAAVDAAFGFGSGHLFTKALTSKGMLGNAANVVKDWLLEIGGEVFGEAAGQVSEGKDVDWAESVFEGMATGPQSTITTAAAQTSQALKPKKGATQESNVAPENGGLVFKEWEGLEYETYEAKGAKHDYEINYIPDDDLTKNWALKRFDEEGTLKEYELFESKEKAIDAAQKLESKPETKNESETNAEGTDNTDVQQDRETGSGEPYIQDPLSGDVREDSGSGAAAQDGADGGGSTGGNEPGVSDQPGGGNSVEPVLNKSIEVGDGTQRSGLVPVSELDGFVGEDRTGDAAMENSRETIDKLKDDIAKNGFKEPIVIIYDKFSNGGEASIVEGNHRYAAAVELGLKEIPVRFEKGKLRSNESRARDNMFPLNRKSIGAINDSRGVKGTDLGLTVREPTVKDYKSGSTLTNDKDISSKPEPENKGISLNEEHQAIVDKAQKEKLDPEIEKSGKKYVMSLFDENGVSKDQIEFDTKKEAQEVFDAIKNPERTQNTEPVETEPVPTGTTEEPQDSGVPPVTPPPPTAPPEAPTEKIYDNDAIKTGNIKETGTFAKDKLSDTGYEAISNELTEKEADRIVGAYDARVVEDVVRNDKDMHDALRGVLVTKLADKYLANGETQKAISLWDHFANQGTEHAQAMQARAIANQDPTAQALSFTKKTRDQDKKVLKQKDPNTGKTTQQQINQDLAEVKRVAREIGVSIAKSDKLIDIVRKIAQSSGKVKVSKDKIKQAQDRRAQLKKDFKDRKNDLLMSSIIPGLSPAGIEHAIEVAKTYVSEGVANVEIIMERVQQFFNQEYGIEINPDDLEMVSGHLAEASIRSRETVSAVHKLKKHLSDTASKKSKTKAPLEEFYARLVNNYKKTKRAKSKSTKLSDVEILREIADNIGVYKEVLRKTKNEIERNDLPIPPGIDGNVFKVAVEGLVKKAVSEKTVAEVIQDHYGNITNARKSLLANLMGDLDISESDAYKLSKAIEKQFDSQATNVLAKQLGISKVKRVISRKRKDDVSTLLEAINQGAFSEDLYTQLLAQKYGLSGLTNKDIEVLTKLAKDLKTIPSNSIRIRKLNEFNDHINDIKARKNGVPFDVMEAALNLWYANILSGTTTGARALKGALLTSSINAISAAIANPIATFNGLRGLSHFYEGLKRFGWDSYAQIYRDGVSDIDYFDHKPKGNRPLDRFMAQKGGSVIAQAARTFWKPVVFLNRFLIANDAILKSGIAEYEAYIHEYNRLLAEGQYSRVEADFFSELNKRMSNTPKQLKQYEKIVQQEKTTLETMGEKIPANFEKTRLQELINEGRDTETVETANRNAAKSVLMNDPDGFLGTIFRGINSALTIKKDDSKTIKLSKIIARSLFPFVRVGINFSSMNLDYSPIGYIRAQQRARRGVKERGGVRMPTAEETQRAKVKSIMGTMVLASTLSSMLKIESGDEEEGWKFGLEDDPWIEVTGPGTGDYIKNQSIRKDYQPWSFRIKNPITQEYTDWYSYRDNPLGTMMAPAGIAADQIRFRDFGKDSEELDERRIGWLLSTTLNGWNFLTQQTYSQGLDAAMKLFGVKWGQAREFEKMVSNPVKGLAIPNLYKQMYQQYKAYFDIPEKRANSIMERVVKDIPLAEQLIKGEMVDQFGYKMSRDFGPALVPDFLIVPAKDVYDSRKEQDAWQIVYSYPEVNVGRGFRAPDHLSGEEQTRYLEVLGKEFRDQVLRIPASKQKNPLDLQTAINSARAKAKKIGEQKFARMNK